VNVSRETRTTPKTDRLPRDFDPTAKAINTILDNMSWQQAQDYAQRGLAAGWDAMKRAGGTVGAALTTTPDPYDAARGLGTGLRKAGEAIADTPGMMGRIDDVLRDVLAQRMGYTPQDSDRTRAVWDAVDPFMAASHDWPDIPGWLQRQIGDYYQPTTPLGQTLDVTGSLADPSMLLPGGAAYKGARLARRLF